MKPATRTHGTNFLFAFNRASINQAWVLFFDDHKYMDLQFNYRKGSPFMTTVREGGKEREERKPTSSLLRKKLAKANAQLCPPLPCRCFLRGTGCWHMFGAYSKVRGFLKMPDQLMKEKPRGVR